MWLVIVWLAAVIVTAVWYLKDGDYELGFLSLILWGASIMIFVDHLINYFTNGGDFFELTANAALLGIVLVVIALMLWEFKLLLKDPKRKISKLLKNHR
jgi:magnesium-transporting ATPase (P-type)